MRKFVTKTLRSFADRLEGKSCDASSSSLGSLNQAIASINTLYGLGVRKGLGWLSALGAINYYTQVSPIANAVDLIAQKGAEIYISIWDKQEKKYIKEPETEVTEKVFALLKKCDFTKTYYEFMKAQVSYFLITGNVFFIVQSMKNGEPINILLAKPQDIEIVGSGTSIAQQFYWSDGNRSILFKLDPLTMRYFGEDKNGFFYEIAHTKNFNPKDNTGNLWGMSKLIQIYLEMEQHIAGAIHNKKLLSNGARPSGVLTLDEEMSDEAYEKARTEVNNFYSGAENAGNVLIFEGEGSKFESFNISPRDMDFANLSEKNILAIYNRLNIPLPFISDKSMTYNNLSEAMFQLYNLAVIPVMEMIFETLTNLIMYRYEDGERYEIHYDEMDIDVFAKMKKEEDANIIRLGITTYNEARGMFGLEELEEGGDDVFISPALVPLGQSYQNSQYSNNEEGEEKPTPSKKKKNKDKEKVEVEDFKNILQRQNFSKKEIDEAIIKIYGK